MQLPSLRCGAQKYDSRLCRFSNFKRISVSRGGLSTPFARTETWTWRSEVPRASWSGLRIESFWAWKEGAGVTHEGKRNVRKTEGRPQPRVAIHAQWKNVGAEEKQKFLHPTFASSAGRLSVRVFDGSLMHSFTYCSLFRCNPPMFSQWW